MSEWGSHQKMREILQAQAGLEGELDGIMIHAGDRQHHVLQSAAGEGEHGIGMAGMRPGRRTDMILMDEEVPDTDAFAQHLGALPSGSNEEIRLRRNVSRARGADFHNSSRRVAHASRGWSNACR